MIVLAIVAVVAGFGGMIASSRTAVGSATELVAGTHIPPFVIGITVLAIGTDLPEIANSIVASWSDHGDVNVGDSVGSAATQLTLVLGVLPIAVGTIAVTTRAIAVAGALTVAGLATVTLLTTDDMLSRADAATLVTLGVVGWWLIARRAQEPVQLTLPDEPAPKGRLISVTVGALAVLALSAMAALWGIVELADQAHLPEFVVSFFLASLGTSLP